MELRFVREKMGLLICGMGREFEKLCDELEVWEWLRRKRLRFVRVKVMVRMRGMGLKRKR